MKLVGYRLNILVTYIEVTSKEGDKPDYKIHKDVIELWSDTSQGIVPGGKYTRTSDWYLRDTRVAYEKRAEELNKGFEAMNKWLNTMNPLFENMEVEAYVEGVYE